MIEGQEGVDWRLWKHLAETVEGLGFDSFWRSDHLYSVMGELDRATIECWTSLALIVGSCGAKGTRAPGDARVAPTGSNSTESSPAPQDG